MKLRRPCPHGFYDEHEWNWDGPIVCPGGVFLPDDTLNLDALAVALATHASMRSHDDLLQLAVAAQWVFDALSVRETP